MRTATRARERLSAHWGTAIAVSTISVLFEAGLIAGEWLLWRYVWYPGQGESLPWLYALTGMALLFDWLLLSPLKLGCVDCFATLAAGEEVSFARLWRFFVGRRYARALVWRLWAAGLSLSTAMVCGLPAALWTVFSGQLAATAAPGEWAVIRLFAEALKVLLWVGGLLFWLLWRLRWLPVPYHLAADPTLSVRRAFWLSFRQMKGQVSSIAWKTMGFSGWFLCCLLLLPGLYVMPLYRTALALWVRALPPLPERFVPAHRRARRRRAAAAPPTALPQG